MHFGTVVAFEKQTFLGRMEATHASLRAGVCVCVCNSWTHREPFGLEQGCVALSPYHTQRSCGREWEAGPDQPCAPPLFRKTGGIGAFPSVFPLVYSIGLQVGLQPCNVDLRPEFFGLYPLALAPNFGCLVCLVFLVFLVINLASNLRAMILICAYYLPPTSDGLQP